MPRRALPALLLALLLLAGCASRAPIQPRAALPDPPGTPSLAATIPVPPGVNEGLRYASAELMTELFGLPRPDLGPDCREVTNPALADRIALASVGPFEAEGLDSALASLRAVMADIARERPDIHAVLGSAGMLCARVVRHTGRPSLHAWGAAIDLTIAGQLDRHGDGRTQIGLAAIAPIFARHGWVWGAGFRTEDAMHFEPSAALARSWAPAF